MMSEETKSKQIIAKMVRAMGKIGGLPKSGVNPVHRYTYIEAKEVFEAVRKACVSENLVIVPSVISEDRTRTTSRGTPITTVNIEITVVDADSGETISMAWCGEAMDSEDKGTQKALTSAMKYGLMKLFLIGEGEEDPDSGHDDGKVQHVQPTQSVADYLKKVFSDQGARDEYLNKCKEAGVNIMEFGKTMMEKGVGTADEVFSELKKIAKVNK